MSGGVPAGAKRPTQLLTSKPGSVSATVGSSGAAGGARVADGGERAQLAGLGVRQDGRHGGEDERGLAGEQVGDRRHVALVGDVQPCPPSPST